MPDDDLIQRLHDIAHWLSRATSTNEDAVAVIEAIDLIERLQAREAEAAAIIADAVVDHDSREAELVRLREVAASLTAAADEAERYLGDVAAYERMRTNEGRVGTLLGQAIAMARGEQRR
jgi:hypothetical protein